MDNIKDIALKIKEVIENECQKNYGSLDEFCKDNGFTTKEFFSFLNFGANGYSDFLILVEEHEKWYKMVNECREPFCEDE